ncbi:hypothetical protein FANTH_14630 [Fusarium anthophilum]|uniref:FAD dependent oxidoreductase domain-containing protein n=1 Tax=Fusarium anthophilum TaxID=48485 RepID=A0A8H4YHC6_9HYPO|nr:hypothetical protein FANTH_14630 [Fusarium anthophilum]
MGSLPSPGWRQLKVAVIGGGIAGMSAAIALRRAGHTVFIYERADFAGEAGASISCAANGTRWLNEWEVNLEKGDGVILRKLISRDWTTGRVLSLYELDDYEERWGHLYYMFQRQCMHNMLKDSALGDGKGQPAKLFVNYKCKNIDIETGLIEFENGKQVKHDLIIGADGIGSTVRGILDIWPDRRPARSSCLHANVPTENALAAGLVDFSRDQALQFWGGQGELWDKIVLSPCRGGKLLSYYCFFPREKGDYLNHTWGREDRPVDELLAPYPSLDPQVRAHLALGQDIQPWRLWTQPWTPDGLLLSVFTANNDEKNRRMKQHIAMYFSLSYVVSTFEKRIDRTINMFLNQLDQQFVATGASCDLTQWFKFFSYDAMGEMTFSRAYGCIEHGNDSIGIISDVKNTMLAIGPMTQVPWLDWILHKNWLLNSIKPEPVSCLLMYVLKRIAERKNNPTKLHNTVDAGPDLNSNFLGYFIQAQEKESNKVPPRFLSTWTLANILGGSDSTASMLRSVVCFLVENPDALQNVRDELLDKQRDVTGFSLPVPK